MEYEGDRCYGITRCIMNIYTMAGGSRDWWNYIIEFNEDGEQKAVYIEDRYGKHLQKNHILIIREDEDEDEEMVLVDEDYEIKDNEIIVYNY